MFESVKISMPQFTKLIALYVIGSAILVIPSNLAEAAKQDAWLSSIIAVGAAVLLLPLYHALGKRMAGTTFPEFMESLLGKWLGRALFLLFITAAPLFICALSIWNIGDFLTTQILPETPIQAVNILFMSIVVMAVRLGLESLARVVEIFFPFIILLCGILLILVSPQIEWSNISPVLENGPLPVVYASLPLISFPFLECAFLIMLYPSLERTEKGSKAMLKGILIGGFVLVLITALSILVLGSMNTARLAYPSYILGRKIMIGNILERIEVIVAVIWFITIFTRLTLLFHIITTGIARAFRFTEHRSLTLPLALILITLSLVLLPNNAYLISLLGVWPFYMAIWGIGFPLLLLVISFIRRKG